MTDVSDLLLIMDKMTNADLSVLQAAVRNPDSMGSTIPDSDNFRLWSRLTEIGWMTSGKPFVSDDIKFEARIFHFTDTGRVQIPQLLKDLLKLRTARQTDAMAAIYNDLCHPFANELIKRMVAGGGGLADVESLLALTFAKVVSSCVPREKWGVFVDRASDAAKGSFKTLLKVDLDHKD